MSQINAEAQNINRRDSSPDTISSSNTGSRTTEKPIRERARRRYRVITSCLECRRRKLKCDKQVSTLLRPNTTLRFSDSLKQSRRSV